MARPPTLPSRSAMPSTSPDMALSLMPSASQTQQRVLAIILLSYLMIVLDISIVITALPRIAEGLAFSPASLSWVQNAYTLAFGGLLLLGARAGDIFGRRRMFMLGLGLFTATSLLIGLAQSAAWLIAARALQGMGAAILAPSTLALLSTHFPEEKERTRAVSHYAAVAGIGASLGLVLGGLIADWLSWRVGFFINLPIGLLLWLGARRYLQESERHCARLDLPGAISSTLGMVALVYGLVHSTSLGWSSPITVGTLTAALMLLALFVWLEARSPQPIMPLRLFASPERRGAYLARMLFLGAMVGFWLFTTQWLQGVMGFSPFEAGLAFLPTTLPNFAAALLAPRLIRRLGNGRLLALGLGLSLLGMGWLSLAGPGSGFLGAIALPMMLIGIGQGWSLGPLTTAAMAGVEPRDAGAGAGLINVAHQLGGSLGLAILIVIFASGAPADSPVLLARHLSAAFGAATLMLALALLVAWGLILRPASLHKAVLDG